MLTIQESKGYLMAITSNDIHTQSFNIERRGGYNVEEVDVFLERVASEIDELNNEIARLQAQSTEVSAAKTEVVSRVVPSSEDSAALAAKDARIAELEAKLRERKNDDSAIAQALIVAQRTGDEIIAKSKTEAEATRRGAEDEGKRILDKANAEKQRVLDEINELATSREKVREQYQEMLKEFIGNATQRLSEIGGEVTAGIELPAELLEKSSDDKDASSRPKYYESSINPAVATYTTPTVNSTVVTPATPKASAPSKDFSGYGDADSSFSFDDVD